MDVGDACQSNNRGQMQGGGESFLIYLLQEAWVVTGGVNLLP